VYLGSADWMPRNFHRRVEIAFPVESEPLRDEIIKEILPAFLSDCVKARELQSDGSYVRLKPPAGEKPSQAQLHFRERSRKHAPTVANAETVEEHRLIPLRQPEIKTAAAK
jgi:polyphosphate kinase